MSFRRLQTVLLFSLALALAEWTTAAHVQGVRVVSWEAAALAAGLLLALLAALGAIGSLAGAGFGLAASATAFAWIQASGPPAWADTPLREPLFWLGCWAVGGTALWLAGQALGSRDALRKGLLVTLTAAPLLLAGALLVQVLKSDAAVPGAPPALFHEAEGPPILLLTIDTLRADAWGPETAPALSALASESVVFTHARSSGPWTAPGFAGMLSGTAPWVHGALWLGTTAAPELPFLAERLRDAGYPTTAIGSNYILSSWGARGRFDQGFDEFRFFPFTQLPMTRSLERLRDARPEWAGLDATTDELAEQAIDWLDAQGPSPFFLWLHFYDPHAPYEPPPDFYPPGEPHPEVGAIGSQELLDDLLSGEKALSPKGAAWLRSLYEGELRLVDDRIGQVLDALRRSGRFDETLIVVASDHGEEFFEHGGTAHGWTLYEEQLRVPLLIKPPGSQSTRRVEAPVGTIDVAPTVLEIASVPYNPADFQGRSLTCWWAEEPCEIPPKPHFATGLIGERQQRAVLFDGLKLIDDPVWKRAELFDLALDPGETRNLAAERPEDVARGRQLLDQHAAESAELRRRLGLGDGRQAGFDDAARDRLRSLGYIQ